VNFENVAEAVCCTHSDVLQLRELHHHANLGKAGKTAAGLCFWQLQGCQQAALALSLWSKTVFCTMALATPLDANLAPASV